MASRASNMMNVQIAISEAGEFFEDLPACFKVGLDSRLYHKQDEVNVITTNKSFATANHGVMKVDNMESFVMVKQRLLTLPIYMYIRLVREKQNGNTKTTQSGNFVIMVNTKQRSIQRQILEKLNEAEILMQNGKNFAIEMKFGMVLKEWFKLRLNHRSGIFSAYGSKFCITNFSRRTDCFSRDNCSLLCFPCLLVAAPIYCIYRAVASEDSELQIESDVTYVKGTTPGQRAEMQNLVFAAYSQGLTNSAQNRQMQELPGYTGPIGYGEH